LHLSIVTDEISQDLEHALQVCQDLEVDTVELREVDGSNIVFHDAASLQRIKSILQQKGFRVCSIASPFLKCPLGPGGPAVQATETADSEQARQWQILQHSFELADFFDAPFVRTFSFLRVPDPTSVRDTVLEVIAEAVQRTEKAGLKLILENEHACNIATGAETGWLLERIASSSFGVIWDPGNAANLEPRPFPEGYAYVRKRVLHMHVKDMNKQFPHVEKAQRYVRIGDGSIDYTGQFRALAADGYNGMISLETHYIHPEGGRERATRESLIALRAILQQAGIQC
jgi:sugar phosphate isomerase/epimerase